MTFTTFVIIWCIIGFIGCLILFFLQEKEVNLGNLVLSLWIGFLGPIGILITAAVTHGQIVLYRKKR